MSVYTYCKIVFQKCVLSKSICPTKTSMKMFIATLFLIAKKWKQPSWPSVGEWINKMCCTHTMEYHSVIKRNKLLIHTYYNTWTSKILCQVIARHKTTYCMIPFTCPVQKRRKPIETENRLVVARGWGILLTQ